jgi:phenylacetic acid degradation operon negative regulatory protein
MAAAESIRPFNARSLVLSVLLGLAPPVLPARALVALAELFGIASGTMRVALSRMVAAGELTLDNDGYRLAGDHLLQRKEAQDAGRRPPPGGWDGTWWVAVVTAPNRSVAERRLFRTLMVNARMGELRPETWMRPANLPGPRPSPRVAVVRGPLAGEDAVRLVGDLWPLDELAALARRLLSDLDEGQRALEVDGATGVPAAITLAAEVVRFLRAEPLLPGSLTPDRWPADQLRTRYASFDRLLGRTLTRTIRAVT